jgi:purine-nucleoside phosphorylase
MANKYLKNVEMVNNVRGCMGFTGTFEGCRISIMASGMGMPSAHIYWNELITMYGVKKIIRTGTCGTTKPYPKNTKVGDIIIVQATGTDSNMNRQLFCGWDFPAMADFDMLTTAHAVSKDSKIAPVLKKANCNVHVGAVFTSDYFYHPREDEVFHNLGKHNILGVEMESAALYGMAPQHGAKVLSMVTVSDEIHLKNFDYKKGKFMNEDDKYSFVDLPTDQRETKCDCMALVALNTAKRIIQSEKK